jgi:tetratricopeptide (TPR) repeat protein
MAYFTRAHELSGDVSERERLYIEGHYYDVVVGDANKSVETLQVAVQEYPLSVDNYVNLGATYLEDGQPEKAEDVLLKALGLQPDESAALSDVITVYSMRDRFEEAQGYVERASKVSLNGTDLLAYDVSLYGAMGDTRPSRESWRREPDGPISLC